MAKRDLAQIILFNERKDVYLQYRDEKAPTNPNTIGLFGGSIESDETPLQAVMRECTEETGYKLKSPDLLDKRAYNFGQFQGMRFVFIEKYDGSSKLNCDEGRRGEWFSRLDLASNQNIVEQDKLVLDKFFKL